MFDSPRPCVHIMNLFETCIRVMIESLLVHRLVWAVSFGLAGLSSWCLGLNMERKPES